MKCTANEIESRIDALYSEIADIRAEVKDAKISIGGAAGRVARARVNGTTAHETDARGTLEMAINDIERHYAAIDSRVTEIKTLRKDYLASL